MKMYSLFDIEGQFYLREKNPLDSSRYLVSETAYLNHEAQYKAAALLILNPVLGKKEYTENEIREQWQFNTGDILTPVWENISEANFIDTMPHQYRLTFKYVGLVVLKSYQDHAKTWLLECFGEEVATNIPERSLRFLEEALELVQATGLTQVEAQRLLTYVYNRPVGKKAQEVGGVMVTLACLCAATGLDMREEGETELARVITKIPEIREKQEFKKQHNITA